MELSKVVAILHEAGIEKSNSRVLFRYLKHFFGTSMFASEKVRCKGFSAEEFQPAVDIHELLDKTKFTTGISCHMRSCNIMFTIYFAVMISLTYPALISLYVVIMVKEKG
jgi:hypothetical protein